MYANGNRMFNWHTLLLTAHILCMYDVLAMVNSGSKTSRNQLDEFKYCLRQQRATPPSLRECVGRTAISFLQRFDERENVTLLSDFVMAKTDKIDARSLVNILDADPVDFRGIMENAGVVFSQRTLQWHMDQIYPGLMLKVGPTANANSLVEFVLDPSVSEREFGYDDTSTARVLSKHYLLPFLLGLKFNLVALVPLLFAVICLLLKKSLFFAKLAIWISGLLGAGGVASALGGFGGGGLGGLGFGGLGGLGGFLGPPPPPSPLAGIHGHSLDAVGGGALAAAGGGLSAGYFPGKTSVYNHYDADELHHSSAPYKRTDRKVNYDKPREYSDRHSSAQQSTPVPDRFYDYEKQVLMQQERSAKVRATHGNGKLGPSAAYDEDEAIERNFKPSERLGWKVIDAATQQ